jgi:ferredoxin
MSTASGSISLLGLPAATASGRARAAALDAATQLAVQPTSLVEYRSRGAIVIIGPQAQAIAAAEQLHPTLRCTVVASTSEEGAAPARQHDFPVLHEKVVQVSGHLGQFAVVVSAPPPLGGVNLLQKLGAVQGRTSAGRSQHPASRDTGTSLYGAGDTTPGTEEVGQRREQLPRTSGAASQQGHYDLVLDLNEPPLIAHEIAPVGYFAPRGDAQALERALSELPGMVGEFEKPRFFQYNPDICAHGASGLTACTRCLDACPTGAIVSMRDEVAVDPYLCQGAGICASVCPTGAMTYRYPSLADQLARLAALTRTYRDAGGGERPLLLLHDAEGGRERVQALAARLPEWVVPYELAEIGSLGMDAWLSVLAYGAQAVALLPAANTPARVTDALREQLVYSGALLEAMGFHAGQLRLLEGDDEAVLAQLTDVSSAVVIPPAAFAGVDEKRTVLRLAVEHLHAHAPAPRELAALPEGAPFGEIVVNRETCTLCMACVGVCPAGALADGAELPQLNFIEGNCVQCGLCATACPENAIQLSARYLFDPLARRAPRTLHEETPFCCVVCGKPFATQKMMTRMAEKLQGHWMFKDGEALRRVQMCADCRVRDLYRAESKRPETI